MTIAEQIAHIAALQWHLDCGIDEILADEPGLLARAPAKREIALENAPQTPPPSALEAISAITTSIPTPASVQTAIQGTPALRDEAVKRAQSCQSVEALKEALSSFDGMALRRTATNLVFAAGNPQAPIMLVGDAPNADDDRAGTPFAGEWGLLMDKILKAVDLDRNATEPQHSIYMSYALNWRPPGNRSPNPQELELTLPFIERHIALIKPRLLVLCGTMPAKLLLDREDSLNKLRGQWHSYRPRLVTDEQGAVPAAIPALCTYNPEYLLKTPSQKKAAWADMLMLSAKRRELGILD